MSNFSGPMLAHDGFVRLQYALSSLLIFGFVSNVALLIILTSWMFSKGHRFRKRMKVYFHLAVIDLFGILSSLLPEIITISTESHAEWLLGGDVGCRLIRLLQATTMFASSNFVVCIALQKVFAITRPMVTIYSRGGLDSWMAYVILYFSAIAMSFPQVFVFETYTIGEFEHHVNETVTNVTSCLTSFHDTQFWNEGVHLWYFCIASYIIPSLILIICYGRIAVSLYTSAIRLKNDEMARHSKSFPPDSSAKELITSKKEHSSSYSSSKHHDSLYKSGRGNATKQRFQGVPVALALAVAFTVGWLPFYLSLFDMYYSAGSMLYGYDWLITPLGNLNFCLNPWLCILVVTKCSTGNFCAKSKDKRSSPSNLSSIRSKPPQSRHPDLCLV